jgi:hypothetical protein
MAIRSAPLSRSKIGRPASLLSVPESGPFDSFLVALAFTWKSKIGSTMQVLSKRLATISLTGLSALCPLKFAGFFLQKKLGLYNKLFFFSFRRQMKIKKARRRIMSCRGPCTFFSIEWTTEEACIS